MSNLVDGVIKYHVKYQFETTPKSEYYTALEALRSRLFALGLMGEKDGIGYGNLSHWVVAHSFLITATQTGKNTAFTQDEYVAIESYDFEKFTVYSKGKCQPSSETLSHAMIYEIHPDIRAVIHVHSSALWQYMIGTNALSTTAEYGTTGMVHEIANLYEHCNPFTHSAFVMKGHEDGIITFGQSVSEVEQKLYLFCNNSSKIAL